MKSSFLPKHDTNIVRIFALQHLVCSMAQYRALLLIFVAFSEHLSLSNDKSKEKITPTFLAFSEWILTRYIFVLNRVRQIVLFQLLPLTPNTWAIRPSLTWSKWNMDEICGLKFHLSYHIRYATFFITESFYELNSFCNRKWLAHGGISKIFFLDPIIFRSEMLKFHPHSILTG
jgi:hypothetical protein